ncbi:DNA recombination protein RmuC [Pseudidiomarina woesei]|uniref:DNA anti-recombination protein (Rearrangement mutator) RmuC n=1 Tax=Pseudidiomarina woesei TaxID=1381080 RepID=A0A0K6H126_9GAMM|nr:DNA recombination protein RmuC [Pseudidiomarina woesei]CUA84673.1 DNA anti-recombination protein (rearrangement mutator) RmuC [Pseudidiomarina woesei]
MLSLELWHVVAAVSAAAIIGGAIGWLWLGPRQKMLASQLNDAREQLQQQRDAYETRLNSVTEQLQHTQQLRSNLQAELAAVRAELGAKLQNATEKQQLLEASEERLKKEFERLAQQIFEQKSERLQANSKQTLETTLAPFKQQLEAFKTQVTQQYTEELKQRSALTEQVNSLRDLNKQMAAEAEALTRALKGDTKAQGTWGEVVLERILNQSGLREGQEYETQSHHRDEDGKSFKPDVVVHLPNDKDVVIDSKVSLVAYERYFNSDDEAERESAMNDHVTSLRNHIKGLGKKNYQQLESVRTLDYVLMFIPIEPAFLLAVDRDPELIRLALDNNIMLVSPTNLLVALRTVNNIWQYEYQNQNAQVIANEATKLYDKFVGFIDDMQKIGNAIDSVRKHYDGAMNKLSSGRGNLVGRVENFKKLGVQSSKQIDRKLLNSDDKDDDDS